MAEATLNSLNAKLDTGNKIATETRDGINLLVDNAKAQMALAEQNRYEDLAKAKISAKESKTSTTGGVKPDLEGLKTPLGLLSASAYVAIGAVTEFMRMSVSFVSTFAKAIGGARLTGAFINSKAITTLVNFFKSLKTSLLGRTTLGAITMISEIATDIGQGFKLLGSKFMSVVNIIKNFLFAPISRFATTADDALKAVSKPFAIIGKVLGKAGPVLKLFGTFASFFTAIGTVVGRILWPLTAAYGAITGFIEGFMEGGFLEGYKQALKKTFNLLVGAPLDLIKNIFGWVAGKLGFDGIKEFLDAFSFQDLYANLVDGVFNLGGRAVDYLKNIFSNPGETFNAMFGEGTLWDTFVTPLLNAPYNLMMWVKDKIVGLFTNTNDIDSEFSKFSIKDILKGLVKAITFPARFLFNSIIELVAGLIPSSVFGFDIPGTGKAKDFLRSLKFPDTPDIGTINSAIREKANQIVNQIADSLQTGEALAGMSGGNTTVIDASTNSTGGSTTMNMNNTSTEDRNDGRLIHSEMATRPGGM